MNRTKGPYYVDGGHGFGDRDDDVLDGNCSDPSQPGLWCQWVPSDDGTEIAWDEGEKFYEADEWMAYIIDAFLKPDALVKQLRAAEPDSPLLDGVPEFADHVCNGVIYAEGEEHDDTWRLVVHDNECTVQRPEIVWPDLPEGVEA